MHLPVSSFPESPAVYALGDQVNLFLTISDVVHERKQAVHQ